MQGFKCNVTGASATAQPLAKAQVPVYCENEPDKCVKGAKQMLAWHQATGNNIETEQWVTPNYNQKCGWVEGAQKDIFQGKPDTPTTPTQSVSSVVPASTSTPAALSSVIVRPVAVSSSTLATRVTSAPGAPTPVKDAVSTTSVPVASAVVSTVASAAASKTSCTVRRPRYTPWGWHRDH
jgi:hypothetical protein